jgi:hypothetical protein
MAKAKQTEPESEPEVKTTQTINIKKLDIGTIAVRIVGDSEYLPEPMDMAVLEKYNKIKSKQNYTKDDISEEEKVKAKFYYTEDGTTYGIPTRAFYNSMIRASSYLFDIKQGGMRNIKEGVTLMGDVLPLNFKSKRVVTHWGRTSGMKGSPRKIMRNAFSDWSVDLVIRYNKANLSPEQIVNVLNWAGFHIGVGGFRKEKTGNFGAFHIDFNNNLN